MTVTIASIMVLLLELVFIVLFFVKSRKTKVIISKNTVFWFLPVTVFLISLHVIAYFELSTVFNLVDFIRCIFSSLKTFAFEINATYVEPLLKINNFFALAYFIAYLMALFTVFATAIGLMKDYFANVFRVRRIMKKGCDIVIGDNDTSLVYLNKNKNKTCLWLTEAIDSEKVKFLYNNKIAFIRGGLSQEYLSRHLKEKSRYNFIVFEAEETSYQKLINTFIEVSNENYLIFLYLEVRYSEAEVVRKEYLKAKEKNPNVFVRTFSRYELISNKFVTKHTIPSLLPNDFFNKNRTIKDEKVINVFFYGFGKVNASLFPVFCQNNQLVGMKNNKLISFPINYYALDKDSGALKAKRLDYLLKNFENLESDLPLPEAPCNFHSLAYDLNSYEGINEVKKIANEKNAFNLFIVSYGNDFENAETAAFIENEIENKNTFIACRLKMNQIANDKIIFFGNEAEIIDHKYIVEEELNKFAREIDAKYNQLSTMNFLEKEHYWDKLNQIELYSNYYAAMNIKFKFNLLGLDFSKDDKAGAISAASFMDIYGEGLKISDNYDQYFKNSIRNVIAYSEKLRWNAFYLFNGYKPMRLADIKIEGKKVIWKNHKNKTHACITSHQGLDKLHRDVLKRVEEKHKLSINDIESYKYDYLLFDNPDNNLINSMLEKGYKIYSLNK
ncbi:MAG: hypothetical protein PHX62_01725 [Bacilli bacterium]|nr:hypothetical protein [Bacilli bacterium]